MTTRIPPNSGAILLRQLGELLFGPSWQTEFCRVAQVGDRSMRRWASGEEEIPPGVWREIRDYAEAQSMTIKFFVDQIGDVMVDSTLRPIPNSRPMPDSWGLHFALSRPDGRPVRCYLNREVLDHRVSYRRMIDVFNYFRDHAQVFYDAAQRKFDRNEFESGQIVIRNEDVAGEDLPQWMACRPASQPAP